MGPAPRDPAGLIERAPEIVALAAADPVVFRAIERGDPHRVYRRLWWHRLFGRFPEHRGLIDTLLEHRRIFLRPASRTPVLHTINGLGATVYGSSQHDPDGTYVKSHFLVFVFVPVFPLAQYLVADAENGGWYFLGKVPMWWPLRLWNRLLVAGVLLGLGTAAWQTFHETRHHDVHVVNGLGGPVRVAVGELALDVPAGQRRTISSPTGKQPVRVTDGKGREMEKGEIVVAAGSHVLLWNVLGAAPITHNAVVYGKPAGAIPDPRSFCGQQAVRVARIDFLFKDPPEQIQLPEGSPGATRQHLAVYPGGARACAGVLTRNAKPEQALAFARGVLDFDSGDSDTVRAAVWLCWAVEKHEEALAMARAAVQQHDGSVEHHRLYQTLAERSGQGESLRATYESRYRAASESPDAAYLYARVLPHSEALALGSALIAKHPQHVALLRLVAFGQLRAHRFEEALAGIERLRKLDAAEWANFVEEHVETLVALGRVEEARKITDEGFASAEGRSKVRLVGLRSWIDGGAAAGTVKLMSRLDVKQPDDMLRFRLRFWNTDATANLAALSKAPDRAFWQLVQDAHFKPAAALDGAARLRADELVDLDPEVLVLLLAEAQRTQHAGRARLEEAVQRLQLPREALAAYLDGGTWSDALDTLPLTVHGVLHLARSRRAGVAPAERERLRALAARCDPAGGFARRAQADWPPS